MKNKIQEELRKIKVIYIITITITLTLTCICIVKFNECLEISFLIYFVSNGSFRRNLRICKMSRLERSRRKEIKKSRREKRRSWRRK